MTQSTVDDELAQNDSSSNDYTPISGNTHQSFDTIYNATNSLADSVYTFLPESWRPINSTVNISKKKPEPGFLAQLSTVVTETLRNSADVLHLSPPETPTTTDERK
jgi:hypothetical protein